MLETLGQVLWHGPILPIWEFIKGFLDKDILELLVGFGYYVLKVHQAGLPCCFCKSLEMV